MELFEEPLNLADDARYANRPLRIECETFNRCPGTWSWTGPDEVASFVPRLARLISWADSACFSGAGSVSAFLELRSDCSEQPDLEKEFPPELFGVPVAKRSAPQNGIGGNPTLRAAVSFTAAITVRSAPLLVQLLTPGGDGGSWHEWGGTPPTERLFMELVDPASGEIVGELGSRSWDGEKYMESPEWSLLPCFVPPAQRLRLWSSLGKNPGRLGDWSVDPDPSPQLAALRRSGIEFPDSVHIERLKKEAAEAEAKEI